MTYLRQRIGEWIEWEVDADWLYRALRKSRICKITGHLPVPDHCGLPEHDYCAACTARTPGMARRR